MTDEDHRRPLASRQTGWAHALTRWLAATAITPNQISGLSVVMAAIAGLAFWWAGTAGGGMRAGLLIVGALFCQLRLLCNLLDGMVAVEAGKSSANGVYWNEFPDRLADILILVGVGYGVGEPALGWAASAFAVLTAYVRVMGQAGGAGSDFSGPMAKPHRMALITGAAIVSLAEGAIVPVGTVLTVALWVVAIGALATALRRAWRLMG